jgi:hypothetical protein
LDDNDDQETNLDEATLDHALRELLTTISAPPVPSPEAEGPDRLAEIHTAIHTAWPDGYPPSQEALAADQASGPPDVSMGDNAVEESHDDGGWHEYESGFNNHPDSGGMGWDHHAGGPEHHNP